MKKNIMISIIILSFVFMQPLKADCNDLSEEQILADKINITYTKYEFDENFVAEGLYNIAINNMVPQLYIKVNDSISNLDFYRANSNGVIEYDDFGNLFKFSIYSTECNTLLKELTIYIPKYNDYATHEECDSLVSKSIKLCNEWIEEEDLEYFKSYDFDEEKFLLTISKEKGKPLYVFLEFLENSMWYIIIPIGVVLVIFLIRVFIVKRRSKINEKN